MEQFDHRIADARTAFQDPEGFWEFGGWLASDKLADLNEGVGNGQARIIRPMGEDSFLVTFGAGIDYYVEAVTRCCRCLVRLWFEETTVVGSCQGCESDVYAEAAAGF